MQFSWTVQPGPAGKRVVLRGEITEKCDFDSLVESLWNGAVLDLNEITRINSTGAREWLNLIRKAEERGFTLVLERCSVPFVNQLNMISRFAGKSKVRSIQAPYTCTSCEELLEKTIDLTTDVDAQVDAKVSCPKCSGRMELDDLKEDYLSFLTSGR